jgi:hypothetical protein
MEYHPKKKKRPKTTSLRLAHDAVSVIFVRMIAPSSNKANKSIPYYLIIPKTQILCNKTLYVP